MNINEVNQKFVQTYRTEYLFCEFVCIFQGFGFVTMANEEEAKAVIHGLNGCLIDSRMIQVK